MTSSACCWQSEVEFSTAVCSSQSDVEFSATVVCCWQSEVEFSTAVCSSQSEVEILRPSRSLVHNSADARTSSVSSLNSRRDDEGVEQEEGRNTGTQLSLLHAGLTYGLRDLECAISSCKPTVEMRNRCCDPGNPCCAKYVRSLSVVRTRDFPIFCNQPRTVTGETSGNNAFNACWNTQ